MPDYPVLARSRNPGIDSHCAVVFDCANEIVQRERNTSGGLMRIAVVGIAAILGSAWAAQAAPPQSAASGKTVHYQVPAKDLKYVYGVAPPVARLHPGDILETNTVDAFGNAIQKPGDTLTLVKGDNPLTGPFFIEGAEPGDTLAVKILDLQVDGNQGVGALAPGFGALNPTLYTPMINQPLPERIWFYPIDHATNTATFHALDSNFSVKIPLHPFLGCIGVAPAAGEARSSIVPAEFGGNMDAPEVSAGNTLYLPVNVSGALLYMGDGHAAMGDGEVAGTAIEVPLHVRVQVDVLKGKKLNWPRFENGEEIMAVGIYRPVDDALRISFSELVAWMHSDYGLSDLDAYELLSKVARIHLTEMVDPNYVVIASIQKKYLPKPMRGAK
ncbi:MAG TPA: acetamidase/formamidase family protein [Candidatus Acidoferrales bacterium]